MTMNIWKMCCIEWKHWRHTTITLRSSFMHCQKLRKAFKNGRKSTVSEHLLKANDVPAIYEHFKTENEGEANEEDFDKGMCAQHNNKRKCGKCKKLVGRFANFVNTDVNSFCTYADTGAFEKNTFETAEAQQKVLDHCKALLELVHTKEYDLEYLLKSETAEDASEAVCIKARCCKEAVAEPTEEETAALKAKENLEFQTRKTDQKGVKKELIEKGVQPGGR